MALTEDIFERVKLVDVLAIIRDQQFPSSVEHNGKKLKWIKDEIERKVLELERE